MKENINDMAPPRRSMSRLADLPHLPAGEHPWITHRMRIFVHRMACAGTPLFSGMAAPTVYRAHPPVDRELMNNILINCDPSANSAGTGNITRGMLQGRGGELAICYGGPAQDVSNFELEQAKLELTGDQRQEDNG